MNLMNSGLIQIPVPMKKLLISLAVICFSCDLYGQHPDLGLHGQITWLSDTKIRVEYDWSDDSQLTDWTTTNGSKLVRVANTVKITGGVASVRSMVWKQLMKCTRIYAQEAKALNSSTAHLNFMTNVLGWTGLNFNPAEIIGVIYKSSGNIWLENMGSEVLTGQVIALGNPYTTEINISESAITTISSADNVLKTHNLVSPPDNNREVAVGGWGGDTEWGKLTIEGEITAPLTVPPDVINIQSNGSIFAPVIEVTGSPVIEWVFDDGTTSSLSAPSKNYGSIGSRHNYLKVTPWTALVGINAGYDALDGGYGGFAMVPNQYVSGFRNLNLAKNSLRYLCASYSPMSELDVSELAALEFIELLYCSNLANLKLGSHPVLERLCIEDCNLGSLDLSGCHALEDLRSALNNYSSINWGTIGANLWHICVRGTAFAVNLPGLAQFPSLRELLIWNNNQNGAFVINNPVIQRIDAYSNNYTSADISGCNNLTEFDLSGSQLTSLNLGTAGNLNDAALKDCNLTQSLVDYVLLTINGNGRINGILELSGNSFPSAAGMTGYTSLLGKGWTVNINIPTAIDTYNIEPPKVIVSSSEVKMIFHDDYSSWKADLYNITGTLFSEKLIQGNVLVFDISALHPGIYIVQFSQGNRRKFVKFVKS